MVVGVVSLGSCVCSSNFGWNGVNDSSLGSCDDSCSSGSCGFSCVSNGGSDSCGCNNNNFGSSSSVITKRISNLNVKDQEK